MIDLVTKGLIAHLQNMMPDPSPWVVAHSLSADDTAPTINKLVLCLYAVEEHDHLRNSPPVPVKDGYRRAPLSLRLHYLITYVGPHDEAQTRLSRVVAVFHTKPTLGPAELPSNVTGTIERLTVRLRNTTTDERTNIWTALGRAARLALFYTVDVAPILLLDNPDGSGRIEQHRVDYVEVTP